MLERDLALNASSDLVIENGDLRLTNGKETLEQRIRRTLLTFKSEWFLDEDLGMPYYQEILGQKNSIGAIKAIFVDAIQNIDGLKELKDIKVKLDDIKRTLLIKFIVLDSNNNAIEMGI